MTTCASCGTRARKAARYCLQCGSALVDPGAATMVLDDEQRSPLLGALRRELGREYTVEKELGRGGMSVVFKALDLELGRAVALKVLPPELALSNALAERFKREAKLAAALDHPNIIPIYRVGQAGGLLYFSMKLIEGRGLDDMVETQGPLPVPVVIQVLRSAVRALAYAHERGIVHRDIKSANILIDHDGRVLVSDFGIARAIDDPTVTATGTVVGTPYFMSPEQCAARRIGPQSDQYSLGVVAFQLLAGLVPFHAETLPGIMHHHFYTPVPDVSQARPDAPPALVDVMRRLLAKRPEHRYATTQAMTDAIDAIPFTEAQRREAESMLRALARGAPIDRVPAGTLPELRSVSPLSTYEGADALATTVSRFARHARIGVAALATLGTVGAAVWTWRGSAADAAPTSIVPAVAMAADTTRHIDGRADVGRPVAAPTSDGRRAPPAPTPPTPPTRTTRTTRTTGDTVGATRERAPALDPPGARAPGEDTTGARADTPRVAADTPSAAPLPVAPRVGKVRIRAFPTAATIAIDGRDLGTGVVLDSLVAAGRRQLRVSSPGYVTLDTTIVVVDGETLQLPRLTLRPVETP